MNLGFPTPWSQQKSPDFFMVLKFENPNLCTFTAIRGLMPRLLLVVV